tara:strand:+ start:66 stop:389 length:324 start_codon:yes stop_codon:yes gene_type:complete
MKNQILDAIGEQNIDALKVESYQEFCQEIYEDGTMNEIIDGHIDIYYYDLRKWAVENWEYVEEANADGLGTNGIDYHKDIQAGQYLYFQALANDYVEEIYNDIKVTV